MISAIRDVTVIENAAGDDVMTVSLKNLAAPALALAMLSLPATAFAADAPPAGSPPPGSPPPVNTQDHPDALVLNVKNPLAIHAGPGKPNVGVVYIPPTLSGKDKGKGQKAGATEQQVMGATPK
jgi:hypothetical protein